MNLQYSSTTAELGMPEMATGFMDQDALSNLVLQMQLDIKGVGIENADKKIQKLVDANVALNEKLNPDITQREYQDILEQIEVNEQSIADIRNGKKEQETEDLAVARMPKKTRRREIQHRLGLHLAPAVIISIVSLAAGLITGNSDCFFGLLFALVALMIGSMILVDSEFKFGLYVDPIKFFSLEQPDHYIKNPNQLNQLAQKWLSEVGLKRLEAAIEKLAQLAGTWDNEAAELQALKEKAEHESNRDALAKIQISAERLKRTREKLNNRMQSLRNSRDQLIGLQQYDLKLFEIEAKIDSLGKEVDGYIIQTTQLLKQIRDTVELALTAETQQLIEADHDLAFSQLEEMLAAQSRIAGKLTA